jgi:hypothetical protein
MIWAETHCAGTSEPGGAPAIPPEATAAKVVANTDHEQCAQEGRAMPVFYPPENCSQENNEQVILQTE